MSSLNALPSPGHLFLEDKAARKAYLRLLENQEELPTMILGQMLIQAPAATGRAYAVDMINRCPTNQGPSLPRTPRIPSTLPSGLLPDSLLPAPTNHVEAKKQALLRDNHRCMLTRAVDSNAIRFIPKLHAETIQTKAASRNTGCIHIVPQYGEHASNCQETTVWELARLLGGTPNDELDAEGVHNLGNVLTLEHGIPMCFNAFQIWLEPTGDVENQYFIRGLEGPDCTGLPERVTFSRRFPNLGLPNLGLPNPQYLKIHASLARIIKFSGAAGYIAPTIGEAERTGVLSEDGSSARLLYSLLSAEALVAF